MARRADQRTRGFVFGRIAGAPLIATGSWALVTALVSYWYADLISPTPGVNWALVAGMAGVLTVAVLLHELAHGLTALAFGHRPVEFVLSFAGGHTLIDYRRPNPWHGALISAVGPLTNLVLAAGAYWISESANLSGTGADLVRVGFVFNIALAIFNALPALPLDGGHVVVDLVRGLTGRPALAWMVTARLGQFLALALVGAAIGIPLVLRRDPSILLLVWAIIIATVVWQGARSGVRRAKALRQDGYR